MIAVETIILILSIVGNLMTLLLGFRKIRDEMNKKTSDEIKWQTTIDNTLNNILSQQSGESSIREDMKKELKSMREEFQSEFREFNEKYVQLSVEMKQIKAESGKVWDIIDKLRDERNNSK
jgi:hypothetical protein